MVSIPFKRESASKVQSQTWFQFPSNGKVHRKFKSPSLPQAAPGEFQFPSNGKVHRKCVNKINRCSQARYVSIPFKRESASKVASYNRLGIVFSTFQFPSNGKVHRKSAIDRYISDPFNVSIPFKRESASKVYTGILKIYLLKGVSIPFKRESASKVNINVSVCSVDLSFNSLQTGKCIERRR